MVEILFYIVLFSDILLILGVVFSAAFPKYRIWPPPNKFSWQYWISWFLIIISSAGVPIIGLLDLGSLWPLHWIWFTIGGILILVSATLVYWGIRTLSLHQSLGLEGKLVTTGPYKYTRNPQYLALILFYIAVILATGSYLSFLAGSLLIFMYAITPLSEEPWLTDLFGDEYLEYRRKVPRYIGLRSVRTTESETPSSTGRGI